MYVWLRDVEVLPRYGVYVDRLVLTLFMLVPLATAEAMASDWVFTRVLT